MRRPAFLASALLLAAALAAAHPALRSSSEARIAGAAERFLERLSESQRARVRASFDDEGREQWSFVPKERPGVLLGELTTAQRSALHALLDQVLSARGRAKVDGIVQLESILHELESRPDAPATWRDPGRYAVRVFGEPGAQAWGFRFEGHHVSLNVTCAGEVARATTPLFFGSSPARVAGGPHEGLRVLAAEEDLGRELALALDPDERARATLAGGTPAEVFLVPGRDRGFQKPEGLPLSEMREGARALATQLFEELAGSFVPDVADRARARWREEGPEGIRFAWSGGTLPGEPHYWRLAASRFAIEYDNVQGGANHVHVVWRDFEQDFGRDVLRLHRERDHAEER